MILHECVGREVCILAAPALLLLAEVTVPPDCTYVYKQIRDLTQQSVYLI